MYVKRSVHEDIAAAPSIQFMAEFDRQKVVNVEPRIVGGLNKMSRGENGAQGILNSKLSDRTDQSSASINIS